MLLRRAEVGLSHASDAILVSCSLSVAAGAVCVCVCVCVSVSVCRAGGPRVRGIAGLLQCANPLTHVLPRFKMVCVVVVVVVVVSISLF